MARLGVNIDHVATLRQVRGEKYPSVAQAAKTVLEAGADQITIHLREDRRHIQDFDVRDVKEITDQFNVPLNFEMGASSDIVEVAINIQPEWICLVPEKREEKTTEGGLNLLDETQFNKIKKTILKLRQGIAGVKISLFVEAKSIILDKCIELNIEAVEIHTGDYAMDFNKGNNIDKHLEDYEQAYLKMKKANIGFHAGHGLTDESVVPLVRQNLFVEYNIGHWIIGQSIFGGLDQTVRDLHKIINKAL